jgi:methionine-rich copper-binding protein CopC
MPDIKVPFLVIAALLFMTGAALAHAHLRRSVPVAGSTVHGSPPEVKLWFSEALEPAYSVIKVTGDDGKEVDKGDTSVDPGDAKILKVSLPSLSPGTYTAIWHVTSVDTHKTEGKFTFKVVP